MASLALNSRSPRTGLQIRAGAFTGGLCTWNCCKSYCMAQSSKPRIPPIPANAVTGYLTTVPTRQTQAARNAIAIGTLMRDECGCKQKERKPAFINVIVTEYGNVYVAEDEMTLSGAKWTSRGKPANKSAKILMDILRLYTEDEWFNNSSALGE